MRFVTLALERYGHFDDCRLSFRSGEPDLHVVYGANEAGKTTSMAAVSDLLFGFLGRSPYNFLYDYSLLRVGAVPGAQGHCGRGGDQGCSCGGGAPGGPCAAAWCCPKHCLSAGGVTGRAAGGLANAGAICLIFRGCHRKP